MSNDKEGRGKLEKDHRSYWLGDVFMDQSLAWVVDERVIGNHHYELRNLCLGKEAEVVPILKRDKPIPDNMHARRRAVLMQILETDQISQKEPGDAGATTTRRRRAERRGFTWFTRYRKKDARRTKAGQRFSYR